MSGVSFSGISNVLTVVDSQPGFGRRLKPIVGRVARDWRRILGWLVTVFQQTLSLAKPNKPGAENRRDALEPFFGC